MLSKQNLLKLVETRNKLTKFVESLERDRITRSPAERIEKAFVTYFDKQGKALIKALSKYKGRFTESISEDEIEKSLIKVSIPIAVVLKKVVITETGNILQDAAVKTVSNLGLGNIAASVNIQTHSAIRYLEVNAADLVSKIDDTTRKVVHNIIVDGAKAGKNYGQVAEELKNRFDIFKVGKPQKHIKSRAEFIATHESRTAYETASYSSARSINDTGLDIDKFWSTMGDSRVSDGCAGNEDDGWIPIKEVFSSGHDYPPRFPGCRCDIKYLRRAKRAEEEAYLRQLIGLDVRVTTNV